jgi:CelD/BcsL family acetyltransferase involved in cellulose biosynthesis
MMLIDVLRHLNTEHQVSFLLAAYLESVQSRQLGAQLPPGVAALPLDDARDIESRFAELIGAGLCDLARAHCDTRTAIAREATEIFGAAVTRLHALRDGETSGDMLNHGEGVFSRHALKKQYLALSAQPLSMQMR